MPLVTLGSVITASKSDSILGISDRARIIEYIRRGLELGIFNGNYDIMVDTIDVTSDAAGIVTLPYFVGTVLQVNVGGYPTIFRSGWYEWHINGGGTCGVGYGYGGTGGNSTLAPFSTDIGWSPVFQDLREWSVVAAICEDPTDGNGSKVMTVEGETMDAQGNIKAAITIPTTGASTSGVQIPLITNWANTDPALTYFRKITRITKPVTRGYVKLIAFPIRQMALSVNIGYYAPNETNPNYRRIKVGASCQWVRLRFRRAMLPLVDDNDIVPISSFQAMLDLIKSVRLSDSNNPDLSEVYLRKAVRLLDQIQSVESGSTYSPMQVEPSLGIGTIDFR